MGLIRKKPKTSYAPWSVGEIVAAGAVFAGVSGGILGGLHYLGKDTAAGSPLVTAWDFVAGPAKTPPPQQITRPESGIPRDNDVTQAESEPTPKQGVMEVQAEPLPDANSLVMDFSFGS